MKKLNSKFFRFIFLLTVLSIVACQPGTSTQQCSVVCLNGKWIPVSYEKNAYTVVSKSASGTLSVHETNDVKDKNGYNREQISYNIAIYKKQFNTLVSYSESNKALKIEDILKQCDKGDEIVIILNESTKYSLPHHRIQVI